MSKKHFAIIGHPVGHTILPFIHKRLLELAEIDATYEVFNISPYNLSAAYKTLCKFDGFNVTIPHKYTIISLLDGLSKKATMSASVDTVKNVNGKSIGYTTEPTGFLNALAASDIDLKGKVVIVGAGGVSRTLAFETTLRGCATEIAVRPKNIELASILAGDIRSRAFYPQINTCYIDCIKGPIDLLINATPCGMYPKTDEIPIPLEIIKQCKAVFDAVYIPAETKLLKTANEYGLKSLGGLSMLISQAVETQKIWNSVEFKENDLAELYKDAQKEIERLFT